MPFDDSFLARMGAIAEPSFMRPSPPSPPSQPRYANAMAGGMQPQGVAEQPPAQPSGRPRFSAVNLLGGLLDVMSEQAGGKAEYQGTLDAATERQRQAEQDQMEREKFGTNQTINRQKIEGNNVELAMRRNAIMARLGPQFRKILAEQGPQSVVDAWSKIAPRLGFTNEQVLQSTQEFQQDPEGTMGVLEALGLQAEADNQVIKGPDGSYVVDVNNPTSEPHHILGPEPTAPKTKTMQMVGSQGPGQYLIDESTGEEINKVGGIYNAPTNRAPTAAEEKYAYLISQGVPTARARSLALGTTKIDTDTNGVTWETDLATGNRQQAGGEGVAQGNGITPPAVAQKRAIQNDNIDIATNKVEGVLAGDDWQGGIQGSGFGNITSRAANVAAGAFGFQPSPQMTRKQLDVATLKQVLTAAINDDPRTTDKDFARIEALLPGTGLFDSDAAARTVMAQALKFLEEIRNRPVAVDPRTGDTRKPKKFDGQTDPMDVLK